VNLMDRFRLDDKVAIVTGSGRGIGRGIALGCADAGADVVITARRQEDIDEVVAAVEAKGRRALGVAADITDRATIQALVDAAIGTFGRLDLWVTNAGGSNHDGTFAFADFPDWHWDAQIELNLTQHFLAAKACAPVMGPGSSLVGIASTAALHPSVRFAGYGAAKAAMIHLTTTLSVELAPLGIRANVVSPGIVPTESLQRVGGIGEESHGALANTVPLGRLGEPDDIAAAVVYLASPAAGWVTGQNLVVSGGR
jgi:7-alpha-hydroxysteroid dehydrogenase